jgi:acetyl-CoA carboxylase carboxyltransferase component
MVRELLSFMPSNNLEDPPRKPCTDPIDRADEKLDKWCPRSIEHALRHERRDPRGGR